jgi:hypothetical protein
LLGFEDKTAALVEIDTAIGEGTGAGGDFDGELEGVAVGVIVRWKRDFEEVGEGVQETLGGGDLGGLGFGPVVDEGLYRRHGEVDCRRTAAIMATAAAIFERMPDCERWCGTADTGLHVLILYQILAIRMTEDLA